MINKKSSINKFPSKSKKEFEKYVKMFAVATVVSGGTLGVLNNKSVSADVNVDKLKDFNYIEKEATALDPSLKTPVKELYTFEYLMGSSFLEKYEKSEESQKYDTIVNENGESFLEITNNDYLHYVSANGDNVIVRYVDNSGKILVYDDVLNEEDNGVSHSGWLIYPFLLSGGGNYTSSGVGVSNGVQGTTGKSTYNSNLTPQVKNNVSNISSKSTLRSSKGLGSSMKSGSSSSSRSSGTSRAGG